MGGRTAAGRLLFTHDAHTNAHAISGSVRELREMRAVLSAQVLPIFHATGLFSCIFNALYSGHSVAIFAPSYTGFPTPDAVLRTSQISKANVVWVPPVFLELWVNSDEAIEFLLKAEQVVCSDSLAAYCAWGLTSTGQGYGGGPLAEEVGNKLAARGVKLGPLYGGTEMGSVLHVKVLDDAWEYCRMSDIVCPRWADQGDGTYELQLLVSKCDRQVAPH
jgi:acyl-coenzyme A synthetase/AMP-(fatty) acid ligase